MCIIAAKPAGVEMPSEEIIANMWKRNDDGAGLMYAEKGQVFIEKGFMSYESFKNRLEALERVRDMKKLSVVMHFRIATHGGVKPDNCHPFPITDSIGMLKKLKVHTKIGVAHNGIIPIVPRKGISDTMEYIATQLTPLSKALPKFYKNKFAMQMVGNAIDSKLAILTSSGSIYTVGDFINEAGILYSNDSYKAMELNPFKSYFYGLDGYDDAWDLRYMDAPKTKAKNLMWLDDSRGDYIMTEEGDMVAGDFAIDADGTVYESIDGYYMEKLGGATAFSGSGYYLRFDPESDWTLPERVAIW